MDQRDDLIGDDSIVDQRDDRAPPGRRCGIRMPGDHRNHLQCNSYQLLEVQQTHECDARTFSHMCVCVRVYVRVCVIQQNQQHSLFTKSPSASAATVCYIITQWDYISQDISHDHGIIYYTELIYTAPNKFNLKVAKASHIKYIKNT